MGARVRPRRGGVPTWPAPAVSLGPGLASPLTSGAAQSPNRVRFPPCQPPHINI